MKSRKSKSNNKKARFWFRFHLLSESLFVHCEIGTLVAAGRIGNWCGASALRLGNESRGWEDAAALLFSHSCLGSIAVWVTSGDWDWDDSGCAQDDDWATC